MYCKDYNFTCIYKYKKKLLRSLSYILKRLINYLNFIFKLLKVYPLINNKIKFNKQTLKFKNILTLEEIQ